MCSAVQFETLKERKRLFERPAQKWENDAETNLKCGLDLSGSGHDAMWGSSVLVS